MANLQNDYSGYATGSTDTWDPIFAENTTPHRAAHIHHIASAILQIQQVLGSGSTLPGTLATLAARLAVQVPADGVIIPVGTIFEYAGSSSPSGWLFCDGSAVSRTTYSTLFTAIGTTYGSGDGSTTFNLPDKRGRVGVGAGTGSGLTARSLGATGGEEEHLLTGAESGTALHTHGFSSSPIVFGGADTTGAGGTPIGTISTTGSGTEADASEAHNTMPPFVVLNYIIKA